MPEFDYYIAIKNPAGAVHLFAGPWHDPERVEMLMDIVLKAATSALVKAGAGHLLTGGRFGTVQCKHGVTPPGKVDVSAEYIEEAIAKVPYEP